MAILIEHVLYQILIILFPIVIYHLFLKENSDDRNYPSSKLTFILLGMLLLAMTFPIDFSDGFVYDFRIIPFIIAFVYGGTVPGLIIGITLLVYRYTIGGAGAYIVFINYSMASLILFFITPKLKRVGLKAKFIVVSLIFWGITTIIAITLLGIQETDQTKFMLVFYFITWICLVVAVLVIENADQQMRIREDLKRAEKLNVISQLAASVAHEVRNPMTSVRGFLQLMVEDKNLIEAQRHYIDIAINELDHAQSIINDYLSLARPNTEDFTTIHISNEVKKTIELMTSYSNIQNITIETNIEEELYIRGNKNEIKQVLVNIIKNGIEAMEKGGRLTVNAFKKGEIVTIEIIDNGKGMTKSQSKKLGTPFYTTKEKGTGVGLTISFQLIQAMKGSVKVDSELGKGTTFTIQFPVSRPPSLHIDNGQNTVIK